MSPQLRKNVITDNAIISHREALFIPAILLACSHYVVPSLIMGRLCERAARAICPDASSVRELKEATVHARLAVHYTELDGSGKDFAVPFHVHTY